MKRLLVCILALALLLSGCTAIAPEAPAEETPAPVITPEPTPVPTPTPRPVTVLLVSDGLQTENDAFYEAARQMLESCQDGWVIETAEGGFSAVTENVYDGVVALRRNPQTSLATLTAAASLGIPVSLADASGAFAQVPEGISYFGLLPEETATSALMETLQFPPHNTPVRLIGLFTEEDSPADKAFAAGINKGMILKKSVHYETDVDMDTAAYMENIVNAYVAGLIDAVYAENMELAKIAIDTLKAHRRDDIDVFCVPSGLLEEQTPYLAKWYFPLAMGITLESAGSAQAGELLRMINDGGTKIGILPMETQYYDE